MNRVQCAKVMSPQQYAALHAAHVDPVAWAQTWVSQRLQAEIPGLQRSRIKWSAHSGPFNTTVHVGTVEDA